MKQMTKLGALARIKGLTFADCARYFGERNDRERRIAELARQHLTQEGQVEVDDTTVVSEGKDNGGYVMAWLWVDFAGVPGLDKQAGGDGT
ncbi:MAG: hypothetical protein ACLQOO_06130 [Terriglobia bacterium]